MKLDELLKGIYKGELPQRFKRCNIEMIQCDSRRVEEGSLFIALRGTKYNGLDFVNEAIAKGARVVITDCGKQRESADKDICFLNVEDTKTFLPALVKRFYGDPSKEIKTIGITGTNGKTTVSYLLESILNAAGLKCGVIGTVNYRIGKEVMPAQNTTPGVIDNHHLLSVLVQENIPYCIMEVSSHALKQGRVDFIDFATAIFTNLTSDHMDYHQTIDDYFEAKSQLFINLPDKSTAVINQDDSCGEKFASLTKGEVLTYGLTSKADVVASDINMNLLGSTFTLQFSKSQIVMTTRLIGKHNIYNILAAAGACAAHQVSLECIKKGVEDLRMVPGRLEAIDFGQNFYVFVDYAHTEDALKNVLTQLRCLCARKIILVFGCGGDRDSTKRQKMGNVANELADISILTNDNPRGEDPLSIVEQILLGYRSNCYQVLLDRQKAIERALDMAEEGDIVLIAGKGHENYQIFKDKTIHFDDREVVRKYLNRRKNISS